MGLFGAAHGWGGAKRTPLSEISDIYSTLMKLGTVTPYLKKIKKRINHVTHPFGFAEISIFSPEISNFSYIRK